MNLVQRKIYFGTLWPAACKANGWSRSDDAKRKEVLNTCMRLIRAPQVESSSDLSSDQVTALFTYLKFLANQGDLDQSARWLDCQQDYKAFNRARQADWHEGKTYGRRPNKLDKNRFAGAKSAQGGPLDEFDPEAIRKRHLTMATRHQAKMKKDAKSGASEELGCMTATERALNPF